MAMRAFISIRMAMKTEVTGVITELTISGEYRSCSRSCTFGVVHGYSDPAHMDYPDGGRRHIQGN